MSQMLSTVFKQENNSGKEENMELYPEKAILILGQPHPLDWECLFPEE